jgi:molecular chaperone GrpE
MEDKDIQEQPETLKEKKTTKRHNYKKELDKTRQEKEELRDRLLRTAAEFDNVRKRTERDIALIRENTKAEVLFGLLTILDDLDRSLEAGAQDPDSVIKGVQLIKKSFDKVLQDFGLKAMDSVGDMFNPEMHDALLQVEKENTESDIVIEEHLKGYLLKDRVLRHAKVVVSK